MILEEKRWGSQYLNNDGSASGEPRWEEVVKKPADNIFLLKEEGADYFRAVKLTAIGEEGKQGMIFSILGKGRSVIEVEANIKKGETRPDSLTLAMGWKTIRKADFEKQLAFPPVSKITREDAMKVMAWEPELKQQVEAYLTWMNKQKGERWALRGASRLVRDTRMQRLLDLGYNPYVELDGKRWSERFPEDKEFLVLEEAPRSFLDTWKP